MNGSDPDKGPTEHAGLPASLAPATRLYLCPADLCGGARAAALLNSGQGRRLAGGPLVFSALEVLIRAAKGPLTRVPAPLDQVQEWAQGQPAVADRASGLIERLAEPRPALAGVSFAQPAIMGVINVTPDSFSDRGRHFDATAAIAHGRRLIEAGAQLLDIGGESTRPGSDPVSIDEELGRVLPVIEGLRDRAVPLSIDTRRAAVMEAALGAGATIINDVTALGHDPAALGVAAASGAPVVLMHMQGDPKSMQDDPTYDDALLDIYDYLEERVAACEKAGIPRERLIVDPGIGFGKTVDHNVEIMRGLALYQGLGAAVMLGASRKSFIARLSAGEPADARLAGSLAAALWGLSAGAQIVRVHDVAETRQALAVWRALALMPAVSVP